MHGIKLNFKLCTHIYRKNNEIYIKKQNEILSLSVKKRGFY